ncbi:hypothetical protein QAD02_001206 [Eretmocerus hayati]|uniref:Uncharacterized protein n=1 Tax=Eretmocerus hayati TaxID=131215 RepID=A0ACC2NFL2_9HYME|nr:hypothetical protein QAD02_001206 [Eretmocerus hayati]
MSTNTIALGNPDSNTNDILENMLIIPSLDSYEIIYKDIKTCREYCYTIFNKEAGKLSGPHELSQLQDRTRLLKFSARLGTETLGTGHCFIMTSEEPLEAVSILDKQVKQLIDTEKNHAHSLRISTAHSKLSICKQETRESQFLNCTQKDFQNDLQTWYNLTFDTKFGDTIVYNTAEGGFLVLNSRKIVSDKENDGFKIFLTQFGPQRQLQFSVETFAFKCENRPIRIRAQIWENDAGGYCTSLFEQSDESRFSISCLPKTMKDPL